MPTLGSGGPVARTRGAWTFVVRVCVVLFVLIVLRGMYFPMGLVCWWCRLDVVRTRARKDGSALFVRWSSLAVALYGLSPVWDFARSCCLCCVYILRLCRLGWGWGVLYGFEELTLDRFFTSSTG